MWNLIKELVPRKFKDSPVGLYNRLRKILGVSRLRYNALKKVIDNNPEIRSLFPEDRMLKHYAHETMRHSVEFPVLYVNQIRYYRMYEFFKVNYPDMFDKETSIIDVGDTSGALFLAMGKKGLSINVNRDAVEKIKENGIVAEIQNGETLTYENKSFDYGFCFQCLEHLKNPLKVIDELGRVSRKRIFLSIPYVNKTRICNKALTADIKRIPVACGGYGAKEVLDSDCHVFEFSTKDFINILTFTGLEYVDNFPINYFSSLGKIRENKGSFFNFFILKPK